eukprot:TRINITY_DN5135_c0_g1_i2.p1 TRINITY_DN5135_c0_g1~~TRINITY_DN5135_c0_g1_i2.p1  ORF type:complete len:1061 (-),score=191.98 TRINITY_DN5135_c0_g1_i2:1107-4289(-)
MSDITTNEKRMQHLRLFAETSKAPAMLSSSPLSHDSDAFHRSPSLSAIHSSTILIPSTKESTKESTKDFTKDSTKESTKDFTKESTNKSTKESTKDFTKESTYKSTNEILLNSTDADSNEAQWTEKWSSKTHAQWSADWTEKPITPTTLSSSITLNHHQSLPTSPENGHESVKGHSRSLSDTSQRIPHSSSSTHLPGSVYFSHISSSTSFKPFNSSPKKNNALNASSPPPLPTESISKPRMSKTPPKPLFIDTQLAASQATQFLQSSQIAPISPISIIQSSNYASNTNSLSFGGNNDLVTAADASIHAANSHTSLGRSSMVRSASLANFADGTNLRPAEATNPLLGAIHHSISSDTITSTPSIPFSLFSRRIRNQTPIIHNMEAVMNHLLGFVAKGSHDGVSDKTYSLNFPQDATLFPRPDNSSVVHTIYSTPTSAAAQSQPHALPAAAEGQEFSNVNDARISPYIRLSAKCFPAKADALALSRLPLGASIAPFAQEQSVEFSLPLASCPPSGVLRCRGCRAYANMYSAFLESGSRWACNICYLVNEVPSDYYSSLDSSGRRVDCSLRPEFSTQSFEYIAPDEFLVRPVHDHYVLYILDASSHSIKSGVFQESCKALCNSLAAFAPGAPETIMVGFLVYDAHLHFFRFSEKTGRAHHHVVSDVNSAFIPHISGQWISLRSGINHVTEFLSKLPSCFLLAGQPGSVLGHALQASLMLMATHGGRVVLLQGSEPHYSIPPKSHISPVASPKKPPGPDFMTKNEAIVFDQAFFDNCVALFASSFISLHHHVLETQLPQANLLGNLAARTGGYIHFHPNIVHSHGRDSLELELFHSLQRSVAFETVMRVQCSPDFKVKAIQNNMFVSTSELCILCQSDASKAYTFLFNCNAPSIQSKMVSIQVSLIYVTKNGQRRIRVHNLAVPITSSLSGFYLSTDARMTANLMIKRALQNILERRSEDVNEEIVRQLADIFVAYQKSTTRHGTNGITMPDSLSTLPLYILSFLKSKALQSRKMELENRASYLRSMLSRPVDDLLTSVYPMLYCLDDLLHEVIGICSIFAQRI